MSNYTQTTSFAPKDTLPSGNPSKVVKGAEFDAEFGAIASAISSKADATSLTAHEGDTSNPHSVTKAQVGLSNVDNTSDANKPVSTATQTALDLKQNLIRSVSIIGTNTAAVSGTHYILTSSLTLTLPSSPVAGSWVAVTNRSGTLTASVARNGKVIMGLAEDLTLNLTNASLTLVFTDDTRGWVII